jgi:hypothetical protein
MIEYNNNLVKAVLLLTLAVSGNFVGNTLGCATQYHLTNNMILKHIALVFIIYFTLSYTSTTVPDPTDLFKNTLIIWVSYLIFTKQNITFTAITGALIVATYILHSYVEHYEKLQKDNKNTDHSGTITKLKTYRKYAYTGIVASMGIGFVTYLMEKKEEYGDQFEFHSFILGKPDCKSLQ